MSMSPEQEGWARKQEAGENKANVWQVRTRSEQPFLLQDCRLFTAPYTDKPEEGLPMVMEEARIMVGRASYMVNGPNREVLWSIEKWDKKLYVWITVVQGRSKIKENAKPL